MKQPIPPTLDSRVLSQPRGNARQRPAVRQTRFQETYDRLMDLAHELGPDAKLPTVLQLRERFGVSIVTLDNALSRMEAQRVIRRRHGVGIFVAPAPHHANVLLLCDSNFFSRADISPFWHLLVQGARSRANTDALNIELHFAEPVYGQDTPVVSEAVSALIDAGQVHGVLAVGVSLKTAAELERRGLPVVAFAGPAAYTIGIDWRGLVQQGVRALAEAGAKRIGLWSPVSTFHPRGSASSVSAQTALVSVFESSLAEVGLPFEPLLVQHDLHARPETTDKFMQSVASAGVPYQEQGYEIAMTVFNNSAIGNGTIDSGTPPDAILSTDDMLTAGALSALRRCGVRPGVDIKIATHANIGSPVLIGYEEELFFLEVAPTEVVGALFDTLEALMTGQANSVSPRTYIPSQFRTRHHATNGVRGLRTCHTVSATDFTVSGTVTEDVRQKDLSPA